MSTTEHPRAQLSAYLDRALDEADHAAVARHVGSCPDCRARLAELHATASLLRALPDPRPSRRLVPRVAAPPAWLAPLRTLTTFASGVSVFLFLATALLANIGGLASGSATTAAAPAAAPTASAAPSAARGALPAASAPSSLSSNADTAKQATGASPSGAAFAVVSQTPAEAGARSETTPVSAPVGRAYLFASPLLWLGLAIVTGVIALGLQRRLRSA